MANTLYPKTKTKILKALLDLSSVSLKVILVDLADYTYDPAHDFLNDVPAGARVAISAAGLANKVFSESGDLSVFDADDVTLVGVTGDTSEALIIYNDTPGTEATKELVAIITTFTAGVPVTPNSGDILITWPNTTNKIFAW